VRVIEVQDVGVDRPDRPIPILDGISFHLDPGERVALLGGNGSGKTTLARLLNGTQLPSRGKVCIEGRDTRDPDARVAIRRAVGLLFQDPDDQFVTTTAEREIAFGLENLGLETAALRPAVDAALHEFDLESLRWDAAARNVGRREGALGLGVRVGDAAALPGARRNGKLARPARARTSSGRTRTIAATTTILQVTTDAETAAACGRVLVIHRGTAGCRRCSGCRVRTDCIRGGRAYRYTVGVAYFAGPDANLLDAEAPRESRSLPGDGKGLRRCIAGVGMTQSSQTDAIGFEARGTTLLRARNIGFSYGSGSDSSATVLHDVTLDVRVGDRVGLMGASGSGKSTLLNLLAGLRRPQRGSLEVESSAERPVSLVLQFPGTAALRLIPFHDDVAYGLRESGLAPHEGRIAGRGGRSRMSGWMRSSARARRFI
jgi:energy-coupling factor transporter ATP-binding protein EcfA2